MVLHLCSGALQVPDSSMGCTVMLAGCVGAGGVYTELGPAGNKVMSIRRVGDAVCELWKPSWAWVNCNSHILRSSLDRCHYPLTGLKAATFTSVTQHFLSVDTWGKIFQKSTLYRKSTEFFCLFFFHYQNCQKWLVCSQILPNQTLKNQALSISVEVIQVC